MPPIHIPQNSTLINNRVNICCCKNLQNKSFYVNFMPIGLYKKITWVWPPHSPLNIWGLRSILHWVYIIRAPRGEGQNRPCSGSLDWECFGTMLKKGVGTLLPYKVILERKLLLSSFFPLLPFLLLLLNPGLGGEATDKDCLALGVTSLKTVVTLPFLCGSVREQSIPCFTLSF